MDCPQATAFTRRPSVAAYLDYGSTTVLNLQCRPICKPPGQAAWMCRKVALLYALSAMAAIQDLAAQPSGVSEHGPEAIAPRLRKIANAFAADIRAGATFRHKRRCGEAAVQFGHKISSRCMWKNSLTGAWAPAIFYARSGVCATGCCPTFCPCGIK